MRDLSLVNWMESRGKLRFGKNIWAYIYNVIYSKS